MYKPKKRPHKHTEYTAHKAAQHTQITQRTQITQQPRERGIERERGEQSKITQLQQNLCKNKSLSLIKVSVLISCFPPWPTSHYQLGDRRIMP